MLSLVDIYYSHTEYALCKFHHYLEFYDEIFKKFRDNKEIVLVEVGVGGGGSLQLWHKYFNSERKMAKIYGIDTAEKGYLDFKYTEGCVNVVLGNQSDRGFWKTFLTSVPKIDIFIDDGGHLSSEQLTTAEEVIPYMAEKSVYVIEDIQFSYSEKYGGGYKKPGTMVEVSKDWIDQINYGRIETEQDLLFLKKKIFSRIISRLIYCDNLIAFEFSNLALRSSPVPVGGVHVRR